MNEAFLLTGGNMGNRVNYLEEAAKSVEQECGWVKKKSSVYETAAWGNENQEPFLNQVLKISTKLDAQSLLHCLLSIEEKLGRKRIEKYGPRVIDIDILFFNNEIIHRENLQIPHPQMHNRRFVLEPLKELAPEKIHPVFHLSVRQLLDLCTDTLSVKKIS